MLAMIKVCGALIFVTSSRLEKSKEKIQMEVWPAVSYRMHLNCITLKSAHQERRNTYRLGTAHQERRNTLDWGPLIQRDGTKSRGHTAIFFIFSNKRVPKKVHLWCGDEKPDVRNIYFLVPFRLAPPPHALKHGTEVILSSVPGKIFMPASFVWFREPITI